MSDGSREMDRKKKVDWKRIALIVLCAVVVLSMVLATIITYQS